MTAQSLLALMGIILAALTAEFNDAVTGSALGDIEGGLGIGHDAATWIESLYLTGQLIGMSFATFWAVTVSLRRFALFTVALGALTTCLIPLSRDLVSLYVLRTIEGVSSGFTIPLLLIVALRAVPIPYRLYGLCAYALTATFGPNVATTLAALWTNLLDWRFVFWEGIPLYALAGTMLWYGLPQGPSQYDRIAKFDWPGAILVVITSGALSTLLQQGDRLDWFNSPLIRVMGELSLASLVLLIFNEFRQELPLYRFSMLVRRNFLYALIALFCFLLMTLAVGALPAIYLREMGYRPEQIQLILLPIALSQFIILPAVAFVLDFPKVDSRWVSGLGIALVVTAAVINSFISSSWQLHDFYLAAACAAIGESMIVMPLLMMATNTVRSPAEGPFASTMVNSTRAFAEPVGVWLLGLIFRWRGSFHFSRLADQAGLNRFSILQGAGVAPLGVAGAAKVTAYTAAMRAQATVLTVADGFLIVAAIGIALMLVLVALPVRTYPPRIALAKH
jgi:MFS transporter, DHA2 family, multidrug resistance protein